MEQAAVCLLVAEARTIRAEAGIRIHAIREEPNGQMHRQQLEEMHFARENPCA